MKILFLDIDGVLNSRPYINKVGRGDAIDPRCVLQLNEVIRRTGCKVVVSSAWRVLHTWTELLSILQDHGVNTAEFISKTPCRFHDFLCRDDEILEWIQNNGPTDLIWAVVDDEASGMDKVKHRMVKTEFWDKGQGCGLTPAKAEELIAILGEA